MWNDLSLAQKSKVMRMAIDNGIRNYDDIKLLYEEASHKFKDGGPKKNNNKSLTEQGVFDMHRSDAQMIIDPLRYNGNPESIVDWDAVNINNTGSMHYDLDNITITAPETKKPEPEVIEKEVPVFISDDDDYRSNRTKRKLKSYTFEEPKKAKDFLVPITPMFMDTPYSDELQGKVNGEYVYDMPNIFAEGGKTTDDNPDIPMYGSTQQEAVITGHRMPAWNRFWNKNFRSKSGWDKYVDRYYARQQQMQDTNNTPNSNYEVPDALSTAGIVAGTPYNEDIERAKVWDTYNNWKEHSEIIGPHYDPDGNYHNDAYANPSAGYLSGTDPVGEFFVMNEALGPLFKFGNKVVSKLLSKAKYQQARGLVQDRINNAYSAIAEGKQKMSNLVDSPLYKERIKDIALDTDVPMMKYKMNSATVNIKPKINHGNTNGEYHPYTHHINIANSGRNFDDIRHTAEHEYAHSMENPYYLWELGKKWPELMPTNEAMNKYADSYLDYMLDTSEIRARAMSVLSEMNDRGMDYSGYLKYLTEHNKQNSQLDDLLRVFGPENTKKIVNTVYGVAPLGFGIPYLMNNNNNQ